MEKDKQNNLLKGALILTFAGLISKVLSALYRIPLQNLTGDFGYYVYQQVYPFIGILMMLSLYGFPAAVSKLTSEKKLNKQALTSQSFTRPILLILFSFGLVMAILMFILAPYLAKLIGDQQLTRSYQLISFGFLLIPFLSFYRGYFQGIGDMRPTAYSQVFEQLLRVAIIITIAILIHYNVLDLYDIGDWAVYAMLAGSLVGISVLVIFKWKAQKQKVSKKNIKVPWRYFINILFFFGVIAALNHMILLILQFADVFTLVPQLIDYGYSEVQAMEMKGVFDRGQPLIQFGAVLGSSFALALIPEIASKKTISNHATIQVIKDTLTFSFYLAGGASLGLIFILPEVNLLLFENQTGTLSLQILMLSILLGSLAVTSNAILQSYGYYKQITFFIIGMFVLKYFLNYFLVSKLEIIGSALATIVSLLILSMVSLHFLKVNLTKQSIFRMIHWRAFIRASISMGIFLMVMKYFLGNYIVESRIILFIYIVIVVSIGGIIYLLLLLRNDALSRRQLNALPFGEVILTFEKIAKLKKE